MDSRRAHSKKHKKRQVHARFLNTYQRSVDAHPDSNFRIKLKFTKGAIESFLMGIGLSNADVKVALRVPTINLAKIMHQLKDLVRQKSPPSAAKQIIDNLNHKEVKDLNSKFGDENKVKEAIKRITGFIHPSRVINQQPHRRHRRHRRFR